MNPNRKRVKKALKRSPAATVKPSQIEDKTLVGVFLCLLVPAERRAQVKDAIERRDLKKLTPFEFFAWGFYLEQCTDDSIDTRKVAPEIVRRAWENQEHEREQASEAEEQAFLQMTKAERTKVLSELEAQISQ